MSGMHGVHVPERGRLSVVQTPRRKDKQKWHGYTKNGLESIFGSHRGMDIFLFLYLVGVYQGTVTASLPGAFLPGLFRFSGFVLKVMVPLPTTAFHLSCRYPMQDQQNASIRVSFFTAGKKDVFGN
jgi:hypothetical protein